jgi:hypothetical protein
MQQLAPGRNRGNGVKAGALSVITGKVLVVERLRLQALAAQLLLRTARPLPKPTIQFLIEMF